MKYTEESRVLECYQAYKDTIFKLAYSYCKDKGQAEDAFQEVFYKFMKRNPQFRDREHEKAWFIRVTVNACKDLLKSFFRSRTVSFEEVLDQPAIMPPDNREVLEAVLSLPAKYREVVYLHFYEDYTAPQIGRILGKNVNTVYTILTRAKQMLREKLGGDGYE